MPAIARFAEAGFLVSAALEALVEAELGSGD